MNQPDLSVAIIFKNESRCLERCLKSLQPLRERLSLQIVMADTGATDGSREIAARYADVLIDFPWINDFAAARNATLERCTGRWTLVLDCDEWLEDIEELAAFVLGSHNECNMAAVAIRNYSTVELDTYSDAVVPRLVNMAAKPHFEGAIHENLVCERGTRKYAILRDTILHHDGYIMLNNDSDAGRKKRARNIRLLREQLAKDPDNIRTLLHFLDSGWNEPDYEDVARHAAALVRKKAKGWESFGAPLLRSAIEVAFDRKLPELESWGEAAFRLFPGSYFMRIDVAFVMTLYAENAGDSDKAIRYGELFLRARQDSVGDRSLQDDLSASILHRNVAINENGIHNILAVCYARKGDWEHALAHFRDRRWADLRYAQVRATLVTLLTLLEMRYPAGPLVLDCWEGISRPIPSEEQRDRRIKAFRDFCDACAESGDDFPPYELLPVASKMRTILAKLPVDDPVVAELKSSAAYQKIAWLLAG